MNSEVWLGIALAYLLGSIPSAYIVSRLASGVDIRMLGDGNVGAKNVYLQVGHVPGAIVGLLDTAKGAAAVLSARWLGLSEIVVLLAGFVAVLAHDWMFPLRFRGGQGQAASVGVILTLFPRETLLMLALTGVLLLVTRNWDLSWSIGFGLLPVLAWLSGRPPRQALYPVFLFPFIGIKKLIDLPRARKLASRGG
jgi:glycerol-3-phosphate acyltransferase PlsY